MKEKFMTFLNAVRQKEFAVLLFLAFVFLFNYPFFQNLGDAPLDFPFTYVFTTWAVLIVLLFISNFKADSE